MICATSLRITTNANATTQTASWQQSLAGAESAVDQAMSELIIRVCGAAGMGFSWYSQMPLPTTKPTDTLVPATDFPPAGSYNYYTPPTLAVSPKNSGLQDESGQTVATWVTVTRGLPPRPKEVRRIRRIAFARREWSVHPGRREFQTENWTTVAEDQPQIRSVLRDCSHNSASSASN